MKLGLLCLIALFAIVGCASKIEGETSSPPPSGGPKGSAAHPPGLTPEEIKKDAAR